MKTQPKKSVLRIVCPKCGELQVKIYPWSSYNIKEGSVIEACMKCLAKAGRLPPGTKPVARTGGTVGKITKKNRSLKAGLT